MGGLRIVGDDEGFTAEWTDELGWAMRRHPAGKGPVRGRLATAEAEAARAQTPTGRARLWAAVWLCAAGARVHAAARALAERVAP